MKLNPSVTSLIQYASKTIARRTEADPSIINLAIGEPDFGPPEYLREHLGTLTSPESVKSALKKYQVSFGSADLRRAIADYYQRHSELYVDADTELLITHGGAGGLVLTILTCSEPGDEILVPDPSYMLYERTVQVLGRRPVRVPRNAEAGFRYDIGRIDSAITNRTRAIIVNSPENPTGYVCEEAELRELVTFCARRDMWLIHDEVYDRLVFSGVHHPALAFDPARRNVILVNSFSKKFGVPGLRVGWIVGDQHFISAAAKVHDYCNLALNKVGETLAEALLVDPRCDDWLSSTCRELDRRRQNAVAAVSSVPGLSIACEVRGGMFVLVDVRNIFERVSSGRNAEATPGEVVASWMLEDTKVAAVPGIVYGTSCAETVRVVFSVDETKFSEAFARMALRTEALTAK